MKHEPIECPKCGQDIANGTHDPGCVESFVVSSRDSPIYLFYGELIGELNKLNKEWERMAIKRGLTPTDNINAVGSALMTFTSFFFFEYYKSSEADFIAAAATQYNLHKTGRNDTRKETH